MAISARNARSSKTSPVDAAARLNFGHAPSLIVSMRLPLFRFFAILLAGCVAVQPVAQAMGACCVQARTSDRADPVRAAAGLEPMHAAEHHVHPHHPPAMATSATQPDPVPSGSCACGCDMAGCAGAASGLAARASTHAPMPSPAVYPETDPASRPRAAHGRDLIRPPSSS